MRYPILVGDCRMDSRGALLSWLRKNYYSQFRRMHISGWRGCATWEEMVCKLGDMEGFAVREVPQLSKEPSPPPKPVSAEPGGGEREAFEAWCRSLGEIDLTRFPYIGTYRTVEVSLMWEAWQARASHPAQPDQQSHMGTEDGEK